MQRSPGGPRRRSWPCSCCRSSRSATSSHCSRCSLSRWASPSRTSTGAAMDPLEAQLQRQLEQSRDFFWHRLRWRAVSGFLPGDGTFQLLDVGAGAGLIGEYLRRDRPRARYRFIEPIDSLRNHLEQRFGVDARADDVGSLEDMDVVTLLDVLEHQRDDSGFLAGLLGRMRPDTPLILTVPALPGLWSAWDVALGHHRRYRPGGALLRPPESPPRAVAGGTPPPRRSGGHGGGRGVSVPGLASLAQRPPLRDRNRHAGIPPGLAVRHVPARGGSSGLRPSGWIRPSTRPAGTTRRFCGSPLLAASRRSTRGPAGSWRRRGPGG